MQVPELPGQQVRLVPLALEHTAPLYAIGRQAEVWRWMADTMTEPSHMQAYVENALAERERGVSLPFAILEQASGLVLGSTRFGNVTLAHRRLEIGWTFLDPRVWRSPVNTECKRLLLGHAFEALECLRVEFKTDSRNERSRAAILRLGATEEGTLRHHMVCDDGHNRDSVYFSILRAEWPSVRAELDRKLAAS